jgi:hypothetical protein
MAENPCCTGVRAGQTTCPTCTKALKGLCNTLLVHVFITLVPTHTTESINAIPLIHLPRRENISASLGAVPPSILQTGSKQNISVDCGESLQVTFGMTAGGAASYVLPSLISGRHNCFLPLIFWAWRIPAILPVRYWVPSAPIPNPPFSPYTLIFKAFFFSCSHCDASNATRRTIVNFQ